MDRSRRNIIARRKRTSMGSQSHELQVSDCNVGAMDSNLISNDGTMEVRLNDNLIHKRHSFWVVFNETLSCLKR